MSPFNPLTGFAFVVAACLLLYVGLRREKTAVHWHLFAVLAALLVWTAGSLMRYTNTTREGVVVAQRVLFLGYCFAPPLWLLLAARYREHPALERHPALLLAPLVPSVLAYALFLTNSEHHLFLVKDPPATSTGGGPLDWGGPAYWAHALWSYVCAAGAVALYLHGTAAARSRSERRRCELLAAAAFFPIVAGTLFLFRLLPFRWDPTASALAVSLLLITATIARYNLLEMLPLARRDVIEHLRDGVLIASPEGVVLDVNPAAARILRRNASELLGAGLDEVLLWQPWQSDASEAVRALHERRGESTPLVIELCTQDERWIEISAAWVHSGEDEPAGVFVVLRDQTADRRYERFASQIQKLETVGVLAAGLAHEVNNPLAFVRANLAHLRRSADLVGARRDAFDEKDVEDLADLGQVVDETLDGVDRIGKIVDGLQRFSHLAADERGLVDLNTVARSAIRLASLHETPGLRIETRLADALPGVRGSSERLGQVLLNLLLNAKQALSGRRSGRIRLETRVLGGDVVTTVRDDGPGIAPEIQGRVFEPFFTTRGGEEGTGLGLSIAFETVRDHGGTIALESRPGEGATFTVRLPIARS